MKILPQVNLFKDKTTTCFLCAEVVELVVVKDLSESEFKDKYLYKNHHEFSVC
jgi:hypothetical protein